MINKREIRTDAEREPDKWIPQLAELCRDLYARGIDEAHRNNATLITKYLEATDKPNVYRELYRPEKDMRASGWGWMIFRRCEEMRFRILADYIMHCINPEHLMFSVCRIAYDFYRDGIKEGMEYPDSRIVNKFVENPLLLWNQGRPTKHSRPELRHIFQNKVYESARDAEEDIYHYKWLLKQCEASRTILQTNSKGKLNIKIVRKESAEFIADAIVESGATMDSFLFGLGYKLVGENEQGAYYLINHGTFRMCTDKPDTEGYIDCGNDVVLFCNLAKMKAGAHHRGRWIYRLSDISGDWRDLHQTNNRNPSYTFRAALPSEVAEAYYRGEILLN